MRVRGGEQKIVSKEVYKEIQKEEYERSMRESGNFFRCPNKNCGVYLERRPNDEEQKLVLKTFGVSVSSISFLSATMPYLQCWLLLKVSRYPLSSFSNL
jgi:hypothetical protein